MALREQLTKKPTIGIAVVVVILAIAALNLMRGGGAGGEAKLPGGQYFYDLTSGSLIVVEPDALAPIPSPGGSGWAVHAYVFGCGACDEANRFIGYLSRYSDAAKEAILATPQIERLQVMSIGGSTQVDQGTEVAALPDAGTEPKWIGADQPQAYQLMTTPSQKCPQQIRRCFP